MEERRAQDDKKNVKDRKRDNTRESRVNMSTLALARDLDNKQFSLLVLWCIA